MEEACHLFPMYGIKFLNDAQFRVANILKIFFSPASSQWDPRSDASHPRVCALSISIVIHMDTCSNSTIRSWVSVNRQAAAASWGETVQACSNLWLQIRGDCSRVLYISAIGHYGRNIGPETILALHDVCFRVNCRIGLGSGILRQTCETSESVQCPLYWTTKHVRCKTSFTRDLIAFT